MILQSLRMSYLQNVVVSAAVICLVVLVVVGLTQPHNVLIPNHLVIENQVFHVSLIWTVEIGVHVMKASIHAQGLACLVELLVVVQMVDIVKPLLFLVI